MVTCRLRQPSTVFIRQSAAATPPELNPTPPPCPPQGDVGAVLFQGISYRGFWIGAHLSQLGKAQMRATLDATMADLAAGKFTVDEAGKIFSLDKFADAVAHSVKQARGQKVILTSA